MKVFIQFEIGRYPQVEVDLPVIPQKGDHITLPENLVKHKETGVYLTSTWFEVSNSTSFVFNEKLEPTIYIHLNPVE